jgi:hypothetical protein
LYNTLLHSPLLDNSYAFWVHDIPNQFLPPTPPTVESSSKGFLSFSRSLVPDGKTKRENKISVAWGTKQTTTTLERYVSSLCVLDVHVCGFRL